MFFAMVDPFLIYKHLIKLLTSSSPPTLNNLELIEFAISYLDTSDVETIQMHMQILLLFLASLLTCQLLNETTSRILQLMQVIITKISSVYFSKTEMVKITNEGVVFFPIEKDYKELSVIELLDAFSKEYNISDITKKEVQISVGLNIGKEIIEILKNFIIKVSQNFNFMDSMKNSYLMPIYTTSNSLICEFYSKMPPIQNINHDLEFLDCLISKQNVKI